MLRFAVRSAALVAAAAFASISQAAITVYTSLAAFNAATAVQGTDDFTGFSIIGATPSPISRNAGPHAYTAAVTTTTFFGAGTAGDPWLSTNTATDSITFNGFDASIVAAGGNFFGSNVNGAFAAGDISVAATDASGTTTQVLVGALTTDFLGFVSDGPLLSLTVTAVQPAGTFLWPTVDNLVLAQAIPAPGAAGLLCAGLVGAARRRRR